MNSTSLLMLSVTVLYSSAFSYHSSSINGYMTIFVVHEEQVYYERHLLENVNRICEISGAIPRDLVPWTNVCGSDSALDS